MRFIEEEDEFGFLRIADLRQLFEQLGQQPQQESGVKAWAIDETVGGKNIDRTEPFPVRTEKIGELECRLAKEFFGALVFQDEELALDGSDRRLADIAVGSGQAAGVFANEGEQGAQIFQVEQQ